MKRETLIYCLLFIGALSIIGGVDKRQDQSSLVGYQQLVTELNK